MGRIIKFIAYNKLAERYFYNVGFHPHLTMNLSADDEYYNIDTEGCFLFSPSEHIIFEQFINRYDLNGKEIYEGDIVNGLAFNGSYCHGVVVSDGNSFVVKPLGKFVEGTSEDFDRCEIIGKLHLNL